MFCNERKIRARERSVQALERGGVDSPGPRARLAPVREMLEPHRSIGIDHELGAPERVSRVVLIARAVHEPRLPEPHRSVTAGLICSSSSATSRYCDARFR